MLLRYSIILASALKVAVAEHADAPWPSSITRYANSSASSSKPYESTNGDATVNLPCSSVASRSSTRSTHSSTILSPSRLTTTISTASSKYSHANASTVYPPQCSSGICSTPTHSHTLTSNTSCRSATVNAVDASLNWWYPKTYTFAASILSAQSDSHGVVTGWTAQPASTTFNVASAMAAPACASDTAMNRESTTVSDRIQCENTPAPIAAPITVVSQTAFVPLGSDSGPGSVPYIATAPPPAAVILPAGKTFKAGTPFVYFHAYEVVSHVLDGENNQSAACREQKELHTMSKAYGFEYDGPDVPTSMTSAVVTGRLDPAFIRHIDQANLVPGTWAATPTVLVVVSQVIAEQFESKLGGYLSTSLQTPKPTLPRGYKTHRTSSSTSRSPPSTSGFPVVAPTAHVEKSATRLDVPSPPDTGSHHDGAPTTKDPHGDFPVTKSSIRAQEQQSDFARFSSENANMDGASTYIRPMHGNFNTLAPTGFPSLPPVITVLGKQLTVTIATIYTVATETFCAGSPPVTAQGDTFTVRSQGDTMYIDNTAVSIPDIPMRTSLSLLGVTVTAEPMAVYPFGQTWLQPGGPALTTDRNTISVASDGKPTVVARHDIPLISLGTRVFTANAATQYQLTSGATLTPGGVATVDSTTVSLDRAATAIVVNGQTTRLYGEGDAGRQSIPTPVTLAPILTIDGQTFTAYDTSATAYLVDGETLTAGTSVNATISGHTFAVSLAAEATLLSISEWHERGFGAVTTETLFPASTSSSASGPIETDRLRQATNTIVATPTPTGDSTRSMVNNLRYVALLVFAICFL